MKELKQNRNQRSSSNVNHEVINKLARGTLALSVLRVLSLLGSISANIIFARELGPENLGISATVTAGLSIFAILSGGAIEPYFIKKLVEQDNQQKRRVLGEIIVVRLMYCIPLFFGVLLYFICIEKPRNALAVWSGVALLLANAISIMWALPALGKSSMLGLLSILQSALTILGAAMLIHPGSPAGTDLLIVSCAQLIVVLISLSILGETPIINLCQKSVIQSLIDLKKGKVFIQTSLAIQFYLSIDVILVGQLLGQTEAGIYKSALIASWAANTVFGTVQLTLFPKLVEWNALPKLERIDHKTQVFRMLVIVVGSAILVIALAMPILYEKIFGPEYAEAWMYATMLVIARGISSVHAPHSLALLAEGTESTLFKIVASVAILNLTLNWTLIPILGLWAPAGLSIVNELIILIATLKISNNPPPNQNQK